MTTPSGGYDWSSLIILPIMAAVLIGILYTASLVGNIYFKIIAYVASLFIVAIFIYSIAASATRAVSSGPTVSPAVGASRDPFTYDPGETANGTVIYSGNAAALPNQYTCNLKSTHTVYENSQCNCKTGYYGRMCEYEGFDQSYVSLTTNTVFSASTLPSQTTPTLSSWPTANTTSGCTNICTSNPSCIAVTYANMVCTQYSSISFSQAPIQTTIDPPVLDTTLYINKSRLLAVNFKGYFDVVFGVLPQRYFVGNDVTSGTGTNTHVTNTGTRISYYPIGIQSSFSGIPDWIVVGTPGTLYISPNKIPEPNQITPGQGTLVALTTPLLLSKDRFPYSQSGTTYWVRLDSQ